MTNYNERLEEILTKLENSVALNIGSQGMRGEAPRRSHWKAKQSITPLIKELVAEAKPKTMPSNLSPENYEKCERVVNQYHQNLLKALEEV